MKEQQQRPDASTAESLKIAAVDPDKAGTKEQKPKRHTRKRGRPTKEAKAAEQAQKVDAHADAFRATVAMGLGMTNMLLAGADDAMEAVPKDRRPVETFQFSDMEIAGGTEAITEFVRERWPNALATAPGTILLGLWVLGCACPRVIAGVRLKRIIQSMPNDWTEQAATAS